MITPSQAKKGLSRALCLTSMVAIASLNISPLHRFQLNPSVNVHPPIQSANITLSLSSRVLAAEPQAQNKDSIRYRPPRRGDLDPDAQAHPGTRKVHLPPMRECTAEGVTLTPLAPLIQDDIAVTASGHPIFFWYVLKSSNSTSVPIKFTLVEGTPNSNSGQVLINQEIKVDSSGLMQFQMSQDLPELVPNRNYYWTVFLECQPDTPRSFRGYTFRIQRKLMKSGETSQIKAATSQSDRARIYAKLGYWYDAVNAIASAARTQPNDSSVLDDFISLLKQGNIKLITPEDLQRSFSQSLTP